MSGLPKIFRKSWENACQIISVGGVSRHPTNGKPVVISLTSKELYVISGHTCSCPRFKSLNMCAHVLAAAFDMDSLFQAVLTYRPPAIPSTIQKPSGAGRKPNQNPRNRIPIEKSTLLDRSNFHSLLPSTPPQEDEEKQYRFVRLVDTQSTVCYGCEGKFREKKNGPPPPPPYDIVIKTKTRKVYRQRGTCTVKISAQPENVYLHMVKKCLAQRDMTLNANNYIVDVLPGFLKECHRLKAVKEFGIRL
jgi:hypothetical protein